MGCNCRRNPSRPGITRRPLSSSAPTETCTKLERLGHSLPVLLDVDTLEVSLDPSLGNISNIPIYSQLGMWGCSGKVANDLKHVIDFASTNPTLFRSRMMRGGSTPVPSTRGKFRTNLHTLLLWC